MSSNIQIEKVCQWCGSKFIARTTQTAYCSKRCAEHAYKDRKRKEKIERCKEEVRRVQSGSDKISEMDFLTPRQAAQFLGTRVRDKDSQLCDITIRHELSGGQSLVA